MFSLIRSLYNRKEGTVDEREEERLTLKPLCVSNLESRVLRPDIYTAYDRLGSSDSTGTIERK